MSFKGNKKCSKCHLKCSKRHRSYTKCHPNCSKCHFHRVRSLAAQDFGFSKGINKVLTLFFILRDLIK